MARFTASALGALVQVHSLAGAVALAAFFALALRFFAMPFVDRGRHALVGLARLLAGLLFLGAGAVYAMFSGPVLAWDARCVLVAVATAALVLVPLGVRHVLKRPPGRPGVVAVLLHVVVLLSLLLVAAVTLMRAGYLALTEDRTLLLVDVTGETGVERVSWAAPNQPSRDEKMVTHRVVFRTTDGVPVAEAWLYGDEVAVKGRVLRLSPLLNAAGVPNLFELTFAHNGYRDADRHSQYPHAAVPLPPIGPLSVHPMWRPLQARLLEHWEAGTPADSAWVVRSATTESTYFPLVDAAGQPVRQTFRLVLTPGGFSSS